jgi:hypothetical protein
MLLGGPQNTIKSHLVFTVLFCSAPFSVFSSCMSAPYCICDLQQIAHEIANKIVRVISPSPSIFFCNKLQMRFDVQFCVAHQIAQQIATWYRMLCVNGSNSVLDTKSQMHWIASAISSKSHMKSETKHLCYQPLNLNVKEIAVILRRAPLFLEEWSGTPMTVFTV